MKHIIFSIKHSRTALVCAGIIVLLLCLTDCRGCRREKGKSPREEKRAAATATAVDRYAGRQRRRPRPANALEKIAAAEKAGKLDLDSVWTYKIQALVDQASLPAEYRSPERIPCGSPTLKGLAAVRDLLKPETLEKLRPYLVRPTDPESIFTSRIQARVTRRRATAVPGRLYAQENDNPPRPTKDAEPGQWFRAQCNSAAISVWSAISQEAAGWAATVIDEKAMWPEFLKVMTVPAKGDAGAKDLHGRLDQDADGDLDIYLVPASQIETDGSANGWCLSIGAGKTLPTWIMIDQDLLGAKLGSTLAHELFHSFQYAIIAKDEPWWDESTAVWAEEYIESGWDVEKDYLSETFDGEKCILKTINGEEGLHPYGAYIFPFYMAGRFGNEFIGKIWRAYATEGGNALQAVESQLSAAGLEFKESWKEFALMNLNDTKDYGRKYKEILETWSYHGEDTVMLKKKSEVQEIVLPPLSAFYFAVVNSDIDMDRFPGVHFDLKELEKNETISVQAVILKDGEHRVEDWTGQKEHDFCLKNEADRFTKIIVVVASTEFKETLKDLNVPIELGYLAECDVDWAGTITFSAQYACNDSKEGEWRKTGAWRAGTSGPWEDQFTRHDFVQKNSFRATATLNLALKSQASKAESDEEKELLDGLNRLFGGAVYIQEGVKGTCDISYHKYSKETTNIRPPGTSYFVSSDSKASGGGVLTKYGMSVLSGPRLTIYPEKGEYTLEIDFSAPDVSGSTTTESSSGGPETSHWIWDGGKPLFSSYQWRTVWAEPALKGKYDGKTIQGTWKSPPRQKPKEGTCLSAMLENAEITVSWSLSKMK